MGPPQNSSTQAVVLLLVIILHENPKQTLEWRMSVRRGFMAFMVQDGGLEGGVAGVRISGLGPQTLNPKPLSLNPLAIHCVKVALG